MDRGREVDVKIDGAEIPGSHRRQLVALTSGVGACEVDAEMVTKHEPGDGMIEVRFGAKTNSNYNCSIWLKRVRFGARSVMNCYANDFSAAVAEAMVDVRDGVRNFLWRLIKMLGMNQRVMGEVFGVLFHHCRQILHDDEVSFPDGSYVAVIEPDCPVS